MVREKSLSSFKKKKEINVITKTATNKSLIKFKILPKKPCMLDALKVYKNLSTTKLERLLFSELSKPREYNVLRMLSKGTEIFGNG